MSGHDVAAVVVDGRATGGAVALITGGASGIGASVADVWVRGGGRVILLDLHAAALETAVSRLPPGSAVAAVADVARDEDVRAAVDRSVAEMSGRLDAVVNCAGIARPIDAASAEDAEWGRMVDIHLHGTMRVCRAAFPHLSRAGGAIVNISSVAAHNGLPRRSDYSAAKSGVEGLTRSLAVEWAPAGIRVNAVAPGYVSSPMLDELIAAGRLDPAPVVARTPLARFGEPVEIAEAACFLARPESSFITGQVLRVDGGLSIDGNWYS